MANPEHIAWLLEGVESWNERYKPSENGSYRFTPDLQDAPLYQIFREAGKLDHSTRIPLAGIDLRLANLAGADLSLADLSNAYLAVADCTGADLSYASLTGASLWEAKLTDANLQSADLTGANLGGSEMWKANLYPPVLAAAKQYADKGESVGITEGLLSNIKKLKNQYDASTTLYFRGEVESEWDLRPSVMRDDLVQFESEMLVDLVTRRPEEFNGQPSALAQWVLAQHHRLKTRFLDITRNPLVALFHACDSTEQDSTYRSDGVLHILAVPPELIKPFNSDVVSIIANVARLSRREQDTLVGKRYGIFEDRFRYENDYPAALHILYQLIHQEKPYFEKRVDPRDLYQVFVVEPKQSPERIKAQSGAFLISAFHKRFEREEILQFNNGIPVYAQYKLVVPEDCKETIINDLRLLNITRESLFPGLDSSAKAVTDSYDVLIADFPPPRWTLPPT